MYLIDTCKNMTGLHTDIAKTKDAKGKGKPVCIRGSEKFDVKAQGRRLDAGSCKFDNAESCNLNK